MRARMATFQVDDPARVDEEIATTRRYLEGGETTYNPVDEARLSHT